MCMIRSCRCSLRIWFPVMFESKPMREHALDAPCRDHVARASPEVLDVKGFLVVFSGVVLLVSAWMLERADAESRKYYPLQFADELSSRYYMMYVLSNRSIPLEIRRRFAVSSALSMVAFAGFAAVAYLSSNPVIAVLLLLICGFGAANVVWQWRSA